MEIFEKLKGFSINMPYEAAEDVVMPSDQASFDYTLSQLKTELPITNAHLPNGKTIPLLKTMQTSVCERNCNYCCFRSGRDTPRASLTPDELASAVIMLSHAEVAKGVFLSSGITGGGVRTQDKIIATAEILREKYQYQGYIHLKIMPGAEKDQIFRAMQLADRVSINLEGPNETCLSKLAPRKIFLRELIEPIKIIEDIRNTYPPQLAWKNIWPSSCTQFVVGAVGETDLELLQTTEHLRANYHIARAYYSKFSPVTNTPFEDLPPLNTWRQHRLYQAFFLLRNYNFDLEEIQFAPTGNLSLEKDPKLAWAEQNLMENPIEINHADFNQLIKIPGIGPITAKKILNTVSYGKIQDISILRKIGVPTGRASKFILLDGRQPAFQPGLFSWDPQNSR